MLAVVICTVADSAFSDTDHVAVVDTDHVAVVDTDHVAVVEFVKGDPYTCTII